MPTKINLYKLFQLKSTHMSGNLYFMNGMYETIKHN
mgnify:CR=1 FL=1